MKRRLAGGVGAAAVLAGSVLLVINMLGWEVLTDGALTLQPGQSWDAAYEAAAFGDTILIAAGDHGQQTIISKRGDRNGIDDHITFQGIAGSKVRVGKLELYAAHITIRGIEVNGLSIEGSGDRHGGDILVENVSIRSGDLTSAWNVTYRDVEFGPNRDGHSVQYPWPQDALIVNAWPPWDGHHPRDILFDRVRFHDVAAPTSTAHSDCLQFTAGENVTIRNSSFVRCEHANVMLAPDQGPIRNVVIEGNFFARTISAHYSINASSKSKPPSQWNQLTITGNTELQGTRLDAPGITFTHNKRESMTANMCSAAARAGSLIDSNTYRSGGKCGPNDVIDPNADLSFETWRAG
jgi:hypothetical protein